MPPEPEPAAKLPALRASGLVTLLLVAAIGCVPTLGTLGYPSALMASPLFALLGVRIGLRQLPCGARAPGVRLAELARRGLGRVALVSLLALAILAASSAWQGNADFLFGSACLVLGPVISGALGWLCGACAGALSDRRIARALIAYGPFVGCTTLALVRLYRDPAVFAFDPFWGMFSGGIYDQDAEIGATYFAHRAYNATVAAGVATMLALAYDGASGRARWSTWRARVRARPLAGATAALLLLAGVLVGANPTRFGFHQTAANLRRELAGARATDHFVLRYRPGSANAREIEALADECELWWELYDARLGATPPAPIEVFLFDSAEDKRALLGVGAAELAAPWRGELYLNHDADPHGVLPHELAHAFGAPFGDPLFGAAVALPRVNVGLIEGFAEALGGAAHEHLDSHDRAAILERLELRPPLDEIFGWGFWAVAPARAYDAAGSFCTWLAEQRGFGALAELYRTAGDFEGVLGVSLEELEREWVAMLRARELREEDVELERRRFERRSLFERPHAYRVARLQRRAGRALDAGDVERAVRLQAEVVELEPASPEQRLTLARLLAAGGEMDRAQIEIGALIADKALPETLRGAARELEGDLGFERGDLERARAAWRAAGEGPRMPSGRRRLALKQHAAADPERADTWRRYLALFDLASDVDALARARLAAAEEIRALSGERALGAYLASLQLVQLGERERAAALLDDFLAPAPEESLARLAGFEPAARELALLVAARCGDLGRAEALLAGLRAGAQGSGERLRFDRWAERLSFLRARADRGTTARAQRPVPTR